MQMKNKNIGFTLIELLVVIVIIGILATISTATFKQYFGKARDAARNTSVANITLMIKVDGADRWDDDKYVYDAAGLTELFEANDYRPPQGENNICYYIGMGRGPEPVGDDNEFAVATWGEETSTADPTVGGVIVDGTTNARGNVVGGGLLQANFGCTANDMDDVQTAFVNSGDPDEVENPIGGYLWLDSDGVVQTDT